MNKLEKLEDGLENNESVVLKDSLKDPNVYSKSILTEGDYLKCKDIFYEYTKNKIIDKEDAFVYKALLIKCPSYDEGKSIIEEMIELRLRVTVKVYDILLNKINKTEDMIDYYNILKYNCISMDENKLKIIAKRFVGTDEHYKFEYERYCIVKTLELADKLNRSGDLKCFFKSFQEYEIDGDSYIYSLIINKVNDIEVVKSLIDILIERGNIVDERIYIATMSKIVLNNENEGYFYLIEKIYKVLDTKARDRLLDILKVKQSKIGGETQYLLEKDELIKKYQLNLMQESNLNKQQFIIGKIHSLDYGKAYDFENIKNELKIEIDIFDKEDDKDLYDLEIEYLKGRIHGVDEFKKLCISIRNRHIPIVYINFLEEEVYDHEISKIHYSKYCNKIQDINGIRSIKVNSFHNTTSINEFIEILCNIDYKHNDVRVCIYGIDKDSKKFYNKSKENIALIEWITTYLDKKICFMQYLHIKSTDDKISK